MALMVHNILRIDYTIYFFEVCINAGRQDENCILECFFIVIMSQVHGYC